MWKRVQLNIIYSLNFSSTHAVVHLDPNGNICFCFCIIFTYQREPPGRHCTPVSEAHDVLQSCEWRPVTTRIIHFLVLKMIFSLDHSETIGSDPVHNSLEFKSRDFHAASGRLWNDIWEKTTSTDAFIAAWLSPGDLQLLTGMIWVLRFQSDCFHITLPEGFYFGGFLCGNEIK